MKNKIPLTNIELFTKKEYPLDTPTNDFEENHKEQFFSGAFIGTSHYHCLNGVEEGIVIEWKNDPFKIVNDGIEIIEYYIE